MEVRHWRWLSVAFSPVALALVVMGIWFWREGAVMVGAEPGLMAWAFRMVSIGLIVAAQALLMELVVDRFYRRDALSFGLKVMAVVVVVICGVAAAALRMAGR